MQKLICQSPKKPSSIVEKRSLLGIAAVCLFSLSLGWSERVHITPLPGELPIEARALETLDRVIQGTLDYAIVEDGALIAPFEIARLPDGKLEALSPYGRRPPNLKEIWTLETNPGLHSFYDNRGWFRLTVAKLRSATGGLDQTFKVNIKPTFTKDPQGGSPRLSQAFITEILCSSKRVAKSIQRNWPTRFLTHLETIAIEAAGLIARLR